MPALIVNNGWTGCHTKMNRFLAACGEGQDARGWANSPAMSQARRSAVNAAACCPWKAAMLAAFDARPSVRRARQGDRDEHRIHRRRVSGL